MKCRHKEVYHKDGTVTIELTPMTLEEHITTKLLHIGNMMGGAEKDLDINKDDKFKYQSNKAVISKEKLLRFDRLFAMQQKHADMKKLIKTRTTHDELDLIAWSTFKKTTWLFFKSEY